MSFNSKDFRRKLRANHNIDHIVELQILAVILLENKMDSEIQICENFTNYFNQSWNLQFLTKTRNEEKGRNVLTYICFKYGATNSVPVNNVFNEISIIASVYNEKRTEIINYLKSIQRNCTVYLRIEESLFNFLKNESNHHFQILIDDVKIKSAELKKKFSKLNNLDHIVELQVLTYVLSVNRVDSYDLGLKFIKYFHKDWNFQIMTRRENISKGQMVKKWIKWVDGQSNSCSATIFNIMHFIFNHYRNNISIVKTYIRNDATINQTEKKQLLVVTDYLFGLFQKNINPSISTQ